MVSTPSQGALWPTALHDEGDCSDRVACGILTHAAQVVLLLFIAVALDNAEGQANAGVGAAPVAGAVVAGCHDWSGWTMPMTTLASCKFRTRECRTMNPDTEDASFYPTTACGSLCDYSKLRRKILEEGCMNGALITSALRGPAWTCFKHTLTLTLCRSQPPSTTSTPTSATRPSTPTATTPTSGQS